MRYPTVPRGAWPLTFVILLTAGATGYAATAPAPIEMKVRSGDVELAGTLYMPSGKGPFPAVVMTHGSEPARRTMPGYIGWANLFRDSGVAALITDKRGVGDSGGTYVEAPDLTVPARDLLAWAGRLREMEGIRPEAVGVWGASQGGWVGPLASTMSTDLAFVVSVSGPGVSPLEQNIFDKTNRAEHGGATPEQVAVFSRTIRLVWTYLVTGEGRAEAQKAWDAVKDQEWFENAYNGPPMMDRNAVLSHPRMIAYVAHSSYEPGPVLEKVKVPILAIFGSADRITPVEASVASMRRAFEAGGNSRATIRIFPGADHGMRVIDEDGDPVMAEGYQELVIDWILEVTAEPGGSDGPRG